MLLTRIIKQKKQIVNLQLCFEEATQIKERFLANTSHELRTPLNGLTGLIQQLKRQHAELQEFEIIQEIEGSTQHLGDLLGDLIDEVALETGSLELENINFHLINELSPEISYFSRRCKEKGLGFHFGLEENLPQFFNGDPKRLRQIVNNLIGNAIKFTQTGNVSFNITQLSNQHEFTNLKFTVTDSGCGIPEEKKDNIWQHFSQIETANNRKNGGIGLGLSISSKLVHTMNGSIGFESRQGQGSTFWFVIPLKQGVEPDLLNQQTIQRVLLAEDNLINQKVSMFALKNLGYEVEVAENGRIAVEKFKQNSYDLILMDIQMPEMDGIEATKIIRRIEQERGIEKPIKIIAITANAIKEDRERCKEAGINGYLSKPFNLDKFPLVMQAI
jgi:CheY-like chemotaxis protein